eukprot:TRINITY_DN14048_c0_g1_i1.p2 TRINITY_DN14048_c0_g1~~TRINITY_DN14048_c0_g1_i1.p2  ORF type:complete len:452 (+),score=155.77 TRINITY_DN14048_c0_g1_i1:92-1357(+)
MASPTAKRPRTVPEGLPALRSDDKAQRILSAATGRNTHKVTPVWCHRQAGRYLPEYMAFTQGTDFFHNCQTPERACTITLQPRRLDVDACILFSDILVIPQALGMEVLMCPGKGPQFPKPLGVVGDLAPLLDPLADSLAAALGGKAAAARRVQATLQLRYAPEEQVAEECAERLAYVGEAVTRIRRELRGEIPLIGFVGAPWTLMCYMTEGSSKASYAGTRRWLYEAPEASRRLLALLTNTCIAFLLLQIRSGAQMVQVFESSGGELTPETFRQFELPCLQLIATSLRRLHPEVPIQVFARGCNHSLECIFAETEFTGVSIDCQTPMRRARELGLQYGKAVQGNLDPCALFGTKQAIREETNRMLTEAAEAGGATPDGIPLSYVANLGWGMLPQHSPEHLQAYIDAVHEFRAEAPAPGCGD